MAENGFETRMHEILTTPGEPPLQSLEVFSLYNFDGNYHLENNGSMYSSASGRCADEEEIMDAILNGIVRRPQMTDERVAQLKALHTLGFLWIAKDCEERRPFAYQYPPEWDCNEWRHGGLYAVIPADCIDYLMQEHGTETPLDIVQTLRDAGVEVDDA